MRIARARAVPGFRVVREPSVYGYAASDSPTKLVCPRDVVGFMAPMLENEDQEMFGFLPLNAKNQLVGGPVIVTRGLLNCSLVHPREVFRQAIGLVAGSVASLVLFHNHPSGDPTPSAEDRTITAQLVAAGALLDIPVMDHVIIGNARYCSFAEAGLL